MRTRTGAEIQGFENRLYLNEKAKATINKYVRAVQQLSGFLNGKELNRERLLDYREALQEKNKARTVNGALSAINAFLKFEGWQECGVKFLAVQQQMFLEEEKELSKAEYERLLAAASATNNERLHLLMMSVCCTGIRVSELVFITVEAAKKGRAEIRMKGKSRVVILPKELRSKLLKYAKKQGIADGHIFRTRSGKPLDRSNICHDMKKLCEEARVDERKVFPHNLRHLFARTFYAIEKNLSHLADVLGHSRIETTRIYVAVSAASHEKILNQMKLVI